MSWETCFPIGDRLVGDGQPTYVIAEIGSNHDQDLDKAKALVDVAADAGADAAKFQSLRFDRVHHPASYDRDFEREFARIALTESWHEELSAHCRRRGIHFLSSVTYLGAVELLVRAQAPAIKIASAQFDIFPEVVAAAARTELPLIMSAGLTDYGGIQRMLELVQAQGGRRVVLLHCVTQYPADIDRVNLRLVSTYRRTFGCLVGYSDHTLGVAVAPAAVALGACVVEKHLTLDRAGSGPDHHFAATPDELRQMIAQIRAVEQALGDGVKRPLDAAERAQREAFLYKWVAPEAIAPGARIDPATLELRRAPGGIPQQQIELLRRQRARVAIPAGTVIEWSQLEHAG